MTALFLYDDARARTFEPFALTRPVGELRAGVALLRRRWEAALDTRAVATVVAPHLADFEEFDAPPAARDVIPPGAIIANTRCVVPLAWSDREADVWTCVGRVAAVRVGSEVPLTELEGGEATLESLGTAGTRVVDIPGHWLDDVWGLVADLAPQLRDDINRLGPRLDCESPAGWLRIGGQPVYAERGATIEPAVCFDTTAGPILVRAGATVRAFTRLVGPCAVAAGATILGDRLSCCSIGEACMIRGEVSETVVLGHANKAHDGFVGHSYLGRWVNLGAGTITSNLKNTYGTVAMWTPGGMRDSGLLKLGTMFGDHVKTGIGLRLTTGTVVGAGSNLYGSAMPPKYVPPFSWGEGDGLGVYDPDRFLVTAGRAMARRDVALGDRARRQLAAAHARAVELRAAEARR